MNKKIRDPIYGYIEIEKEFVCDIIDTATFQRLRNIRQTSYGPLYPAALHNRFTHSLGVYHLGKIAFRALKRSADEFHNQEIKGLDDLAMYDWDKYERLFMLACLLHDVGHAPFSHTGEKFYAGSKSVIKDPDEYPDGYTCEKHLVDLTHDKAFEISVGADRPALHEVMSCIVALESFSDFFHTNDERSFFARCITGILYDDMPKNEKDYTSLNELQYMETRKKGLKNCFIKLLHSNVIDVDRLDYIIRDARTMGYQSVSIDYERLLNGMVFVETEKYRFDVGFHKNAVSVIENAVYAHDNEKKWVQSHPVILYDAFLIERSIATIENELKKMEHSAPQSTLISYDSLTDEGSKFGNIRVRYLCDSDVIYLMKNVYSSSYSEEYFSRNTRRRALWKSEAEFRSFFYEQEQKQLNKLIFSIMGTGDETQGSIELLKTLEQIEADLNVTDNERGREYLTNRRNYILTIFDVCEKYHVKNDILILSTSFFKSNFSKGQVKKINILFPPNTKADALGDVSTILSSMSSSEKELYYLFYYPPKNKESLSRREFAKDLYDKLSKNI